MPRGKPRVNHGSVVAMLRGGMSYPDVARIAGCTESHVSAIGRKHGLRKHNRHHSMKRLIEVGPKDPRWEAWLAHWGRASDLDASNARDIRRARRSVIVPAHWPPDSAEPDVVALGQSFAIAWGTPEHAAWLCELRSADPATAQGHDLGKSRLIRPTRWPEDAI